MNQYGTAQPQALLPLDSNVSDFRFVAFDTETTGISASDEVIEIAALAFDEDFEHRKFSSFVKPTQPIPAGATAIHGISDADVADAPSFSRMWEQFHDFLKFAGTPKLTMAHNAPFDIGMLANGAKRAGLKPRGSGEVISEDNTLAVLDTCMLAKRLLPELPNHRLGTLAEHFKFPEKNFHRAMADVAALKHIFMSMIGLAADKMTGPFTVERLIEFAGGYNLWDLATGNAEFVYSPRLKELQDLCGTEERVMIEYEIEGNSRYITPTRVRTRGMRIYVDAICHRDGISKTFSAEKILRVKR